MFVVSTVELRIRRVYVASAAGGGVRRTVTLTLEAHEVIESNFGIPHRVVGLCGAVVHRSVVILHALLYCVCEPSLPTGARSCICRFLGVTRVSVDDISTQSVPNAVYGPYTHITYMVCA